MKLAHQNSPAHDTTYPAQIQPGSTAFASRHSQPMSSKSSSLTTFLENYNEPISIKSHDTHLLQISSVSLALQSGPLIVKRFSYEHGEIYEVSSSNQYGFGLAVQLPWYYFGRMMLNIFIVRQSHQRLDFSLRCDFSFPSVVPHSAAIMKLAYTGDIPGMETLFKTGKASPNDVTSDGTSLLHVRLPFGEGCSYSRNKL